MSVLAIQAQRILQSRSGPHRYYPLVILQYLVVDRQGLAQCFLGFSVALVVRFGSCEAFCFRFFQAFQGVFEFLSLLKPENRQEGVVGGQVGSFTFQMVFAFSLLVTELATVHRRSGLNPGLD